MKYTCMALFLTVLSVSSCLTQSTTATKAAKGPANVSAQHNKQTPRIYEENDTTDIFAIPLDNDELSQDEEMQQEEEYGRKKIK